MCPVYIVIEGGPGTEHEAQVAKANGAILIPVGRSGGFAAELHRDLPQPPSGVSQSRWDNLGTRREDAKQVGDDVVEIIKSIQIDLKKK